MSRLMRNGNTIHDPRHSRTFQEVRHGRQYLRRTARLTLREIPPQCYSTDMIRLPRTIRRGWSRADAKTL
jgi:hypothetical protein